MAAGKMRNYISYATSLFLERGFTSIILKAMGRAINKSVTICEIIKRRIMGLHQNCEIGSVDLTDTWEPLEEGLSRVETTRHVSVISITLSIEALNPELPGYQAPLPESMVKPLQEDIGMDEEGESATPSTATVQTAPPQQLQVIQQPAQQYLQPQHQQLPPAPAQFGARGGRIRGSGRGRGRGFRERGQDGQGGPRGNRMDPPLGFLA